MDLTIPHNIWPILRENLDELLAITEAHSTRHLSNFTGATYVLEAIAAGHLPASTTRLKLPISLSNLDCPVEAGNTAEWTEKERLVAEKAEEIKSVEEFLARVSVHHIQLEISNTNHADEDHGAQKKRPVHQN
jgi:hypothetical protein